MTRIAALDELYSQISDLPMGPARLPLLNKAIALAEEASDERSLYELRMVLAESANRADDDETSAAAFSWVLEKHTADPEKFPLAIWEPDPTDLAWLFKWVIDSLGQNSAISREQIEATMAAMEELYTRDGLGRSAVAAYRLSTALLLGDVDRLAGLASTARTTPQDEHSDCMVCTQHGLTSAELAQGNFAAAFSQTAEILATGDSCLSEPQLLLADMLMPLLLAGDTATVGQYAHRVLDKRWAAASERMGGIAELLKVCAVTENVPLGLDLLERWLPDLAVVLYDDATRLGFFTGAALLLDRAGKHQLGPRLVRDSLGVLTAQGIATAALTVDSLTADFWAAAERLAAAFDHGRGNNYRSALLAQARTWRELSVPLDLGREVADPLITAPTPAPVTARDWAEQTFDRLWSAEPSQVVASVDRALALAGLSPAAHCDLLGYRARALSSMLQIEAGVSTLAALAPAAQHQAAQAYAAYLDALRSTGRGDRAEVLSRLGLERYDHDYYPDSAVLTAMVDQLSAAGVAPAELAVIGFYLAGSLGQGGELEQAAQQAIDAGEASLVGATELEKGSNCLIVTEVLSGAGHPEASAWAQRTLRHASGSRSLRASALMLLARLEGRAGNFVPAASAAREAGQLFLGLDAGAQAVQAAALQAAALEDAGDLAGAVQATRRAAEIGELVEGLDQFSLRIELGRRLVQVGKADQAVAVLDAVDSEMYDQDLEETPEAFDCAYWLGQAHLATDNPDATANLWQLALDNSLALDDHRRSVTFGRALGNLLADYSQYERAIETFEAVREAAIACDDSLMVVGIDERVGLTTCINSDETGLEFLARAKARALELGADWVVADVTDSTARGLQALGRTEEAVAAALSASDGFTSAGDDSGARNALGYAAAVLSEAGRLDQAIALLDPVATEENGLSEMLADLRSRRGGTS